MTGIIKYLPRRDETLRVRQSGHQFGSNWLPGGIHDVDEPLPGNGDHWPHRAVEGYLGEGHEVGPDHGQNVLEHCHPRHSSCFSKSIELIGERCWDLLRKKKTWCLPSSRTPRGAGEKRTRSLTSRRWCRTRQGLSGAGRRTDLARCFWGED